MNFDRAWEGVASDIAFNPEQSRNISLDIRYALFIIDKFAGAGYLLDEMTIIEVLSNLLFSLCETLGENFCVVSVFSSICKNLTNPRFINYANQYS